MTESKKLVTAIVVVYNGEKYLNDCLRSIVDQDYHPLETLVIDDGSTDSTPDIIKSFGGKIRYYRQKNGGEASARNKGIELANGDYINFLDADDIWCPGKISTQVAVLDEYPQYGVVFGDFCRINDSFRYNSFHELNIEPMKSKIDSNWSGWLFPRMLLDSWVHIITAMARKNVFSAIGEFNSENIIGTDYDFWIRTSRKFQMAKIPYQVALYRDNPTSVTSKFVKRNFPAEIVTKYIKKYGIIDPKGGALTSSQIRKRLFDLWFIHGYVARNNGKYSSAVQSFGKALKYSPICLNAYKNIIFSAFKLIAKCSKIK